ncbi:hypothetical protein [Pontimicrobium aquaticum]|uniref:Uncharacterized protein n=1 Tax=Pontimicrobium aquaticum TaxID=2565367 RepID=A0A4U0F0B9_9FLAO|nr:hypothetical protein [Pontimicrobium aquaticum]TJY37164.1 hypothetical protein E5167_04240 [Pontimicrobium aquaticum]
MKKILAIALILSCITSTIAQKNLNDYKYVIVPYKYDFVNEKDKYQLNSLSKFLFNKYGFEAIMEDGDFPEDLIKNRCLGLRSDVLKEKGMFVTKLKVQLKNCDGDIIFTTKIGSTREKQYKTAYTLALRGAFEDFESVKYSYKPNETILSRATTNGTHESSIEEIEKLKEEINTLKEKKESAVIEKLKEEVVEQPIENKNDVKKVTEKSDENVLYAQKVSYGYQLVDKTPKVVMILLETSKTDVFLVKDTNALVYKEGGFWYLSKNDGSKPTLETLNIKF